MLNLAIVSPPFYPGFILASRTPTTIIGVLQQGHLYLSWKVVYTEQAQKDAKQLSTSGLKSKAKEIIDILKTNPYQTPPPYEKLMGDLSGAYSRRINIQHRIVYQVIKTDNVVKIIRMWTHYE